MTLVRRLVGLLPLVALLIAALGPARALSPAQAGDDPIYPLQWGLDAIGAGDAWPVASGTGITIAVVDSGVGFEHEDLAGQQAPGGHATCIGTDGDAARCTSGGPTDGHDDAGHGTHVAGIAAAATGNGRGIAGVAPGARIMAVRVLENRCETPESCTLVGSPEDVTAAIRWAVDHGARIVNLSLGGSKVQSLVNPAFRQAVQYAWSKGAIVVAAAGNDDVPGSGFTDEPALVVAATNRGGQVATYSLTNGVGRAQWGLAAPGGEQDSRDSCNSGAPNGIVSTYVNPATPEDDYYCQAGTSMAAAFVSGAAALLLSAGLTPQQVVDRLLSSADDLGPTGRDDTYGAGTLNLTAAVAGMPRPLTTTTTPPTSEPPPTEPPATDTTVTTTAPPPTEPPTTAAPPPPADAATPVELETAGQNGPADDLPRGAVSVAVLLIVLIGAASGWLLVQGAAWARRTPT